MSAEAAVVPVALAGGARARAGSMAAVAIAYLAIVLAAAIYPLVSPLRDWQGPANWLGITPQGQAFHAAAGILWLAPLLVAMAREPDGRLWKLIFAWIVADRVYAVSFVPDSLAWSIARPLTIVAIPLFLHLLLAFPSGRLRDRYERGVVLFAYAFAVGSTVLIFLVMPVVFACEPDCIRNLLVVWPSLELTGSLERIRVLVFVLAIVPLVLGGLWRHWRDASAAGRRALLPLVVAVPMLALVVSLDNLTATLPWEPGADFFASRAGEVITLAVPLVLPVGLLVGILQARLGRGRVAGLIVALGRGVPVGGLRDVLARTLADPSLELAFAAPSGAGFVDAGGRSIELPTGDAARMVTRLERDGQLLGVLVHDPAIEAEDPGLLEAVGNAARLALENERLAAEVRAQLEEVRASRTRIVEAADAERRRIERDLHDGAQQRLVALALRLQVAKETTVGAAALLDEATAELRAAVGEVRGLARGVHPAILTEAGLRAAVEALAERTPLPVTVDIPDQRFPAQVETTAYFIVAEAVTNVARHAGASHAQVAASVTGARLVITVTDDGAGGADPAAGSGLRGLSDRVAAAGGSLAVTSPPGGGTALRAELPLEPALAGDERAAGSAGGTDRLGSSPVLAVRATPVTAPADRHRARPLTMHPVGLMLVVVALIAGLAVVAALGGLQEREPDHGLADSFARPFAYQVPGGSGIRLYVRSDLLQVLMDAPNAQHGISIWSVRDVLADPCRPEGSLATWAPGPDGLLAHLRSVRRLVVRDEQPVAVAGLPATRVDVTVEDEDSRCADQDALVLWRDDASEVGITINEPERVRLILLDLDGATLAFEIWSRDDLEEWLGTAEPIVESIRFLNAAAP